MPEISVYRVGSVATEHPDYIKQKNLWRKIRDCMDGEEKIKDSGETYLPRPSGMTGEYADAYLPYKERSHFPLIVSYALSGALGVIITKLPEFNVPKELEYILKTSTKDGRSLQQLFIDMVIEVFQTGRAPILIDIFSEKNEFRLVHYKAENLINWKLAIQQSEKDLLLGVLKENRPALTEKNDPFSQDYDDMYRVLSKDASGHYITQVIDFQGKLYPSSVKTPMFMGRSTCKIPLFVAGSLNNSFEAQPIPLIPVANCSIQIYRKEADLSNSEYLSCNPTLCIVGAENNKDIPNVVGSSVLIVLPNEQARVFYTTTDTAALQHVKNHIDSLYEEAIRHGVAILDARKGVEAAEALRIRQATQSASIYSIYLSTANALCNALKEMCKWAGYNDSKVTVDAPSALTQALPDSSLLKELIEGHLSKVIPLDVLHRYMVQSGLVDSKVNFEEYKNTLKKEKEENPEETLTVKTNLNKVVNKTELNPKIQ